MSSSPVTQTTQLVVADKATKTRQPTLPDKYGKFIQFAYYMMENVLGDEFQMDKVAFLEKIALFGSVAEQQSLVQGFLNGAKDNKKTIKTVISDRKKAEAKANKPARKSRAKVAAVEVDGASAAVAPKRSRKSTKTVVQAANDQLLDDLVQIAAAQTQPAVVQEPVIELVPEPVIDVVVAVVEEKKPKKKAAAKKPAAEPVAAAADEPLNITNELVPETFIATEQVKEKAAAPKRKSQPKKAAAAKTDAPNTPILEDVVIAGTDIEVSPITIDGKTYFMDEMSNLYAHPIPSASSIGKYSPLTRKITHN